LSTKTTYALRNMVDGVVLDRNVVDGVVLDAEA
jgi:hypothetical protein